MEDGKWDDNVERMRAFVAALRSGQWKQTVGRLEYHRRYCCLGVACEVAIAGGAALTRTRRDDFSTWYGDYASGSNIQLPDAAAAWYGMRAGEPNVQIPHALAQRHMHNPASQNSGWNLRVTWTHEKRYPAPVLNDALRFTFEEIADCFEYTYLREDWDARAAS